MKHNEIRHRRRTRDPRWTLAALLSLVLLLLAGPAGAVADPHAIDDADIAVAIDQELFQARGVQADAIDVDVEMGIATLAGTVDNLLSKQRAERIASMVKGVRAVINEIEVLPAPRPDVDIRKDIERTFITDPVADSWELQAEVDRGVATLTGTVDSWRERQIAERLAQGVKGVARVENEIDVRYTKERTDREIEIEIEEIFAWNAHLDDAMIEVEVTDGHVELSGSVGSAYEKAEAIDALWVQGVESVDAEKLEIEWWERDRMRRDERFAELTDFEIRQAVEDAFLMDPRVDSFALEAEVENGVATLTGTVDNLKAKRSAAADAAGTVGVWRVRNLIKVRPDGTRSDATIADDVRSKLLIDPFVDRFELSVLVHNGVARLSGTVDSQFEKRQAEDLAARVDGVVQVENRIDVYAVPKAEQVGSYDWDVIHSDYDFGLTAAPYLADWEVSQEIRDELYWSPFVDADQVTVTVENGVATLSGTVDSWKERQIAAQEALQGGALAVRNELEVDSAFDLPIL